MRSRGVVLVRSLLKSSLDNYVLPGTSAGTEILCVYLINWKRVGRFIAPALCWLMEWRFEVQGDRTSYVCSTPYQTHEAADTGDSDPLSDGLTG